MQIDRSRRVLLEGRCYLPYLCQKQNAFPYQLLILIYYGTKKKVCALFIGSIGCQESVGKNSAPVCAKAMKSIFEELGGEKDFNIIEYNRKRLMNSQFHITSTLTLLGITLTRIIFKDSARTAY